MTATLPGWPVQPAEHAIRDRPLIRCGELRDLPAFGLQVLGLYRLEPRAVACRVWTSEGAVIHVPRSTYSSGAGVRSARSPDEHGVETDVNPPAVVGLCTSGCVRSNCQQYPDAVSSASCIAEDRFDVKCIQAACKGRGLCRGKQSSFEKADKEA